jgi:hypothetical protein
MDLTVQRAVQANGLANVSAYLALADETARVIGYPGPALREAYHRQVLMLLAQGYTQLFATRVEQPDWVPHTGSLHPWGAPNHDTVYGFAPIDARGVYRIGGTQGTETIAQLMFRKDGANTGKVHGATLSEIDVQALKTGVDRQFSLLLAAQRPAGYDGLWFPIPPEATGLIARHVTETAEQRDGIWSLERLDHSTAAAAASPADIELRMATMTRFAAAMNEMLLRLVKKMQDAGNINKLVGDKFQGNGGIADQMYYQGLFELGDDEVIVVETAMPSEVNYWSVQLLDPFYSAIDFIFHSAAYNGRQALLDSDGRARFVIATQDPGVPNWLDPAGWQRGGLFWRWHRASSFPQPQLTRLPAKDLRSVLPADTPGCSSEQRADMRSRRISHYQSRRRW